MARPIEPTPTLDGEDADRLLESLDKHASPAEMKARLRRAKEYLEEIRKTKSLACRKTDGEFQFEPTHKLHMFSSAEPDLRSEAMKRACWERKPLPPEVLADALQDRCHEDVEPAKDSQ